MTMKKNHTELHEIQENKGKKAKYCQHQTSFKIIITGKLQMFEKKVVTGEYVGKPLHL